LSQRWDGGKQASRQDYNASLVDYWFHPAHARQHDYLGPAYLLVHFTFQLLSGLVSLLRPIAGYPPQHAYNPLERALLCVPFDALIAPELPSGQTARQVLEAFGLAPL